MGRKGVIYTESLYKTLPHHLLSICRALSFHATEFIAVPVTINYMFRCRTIGCHIASTHICSADLPMYVLDTSSPWLVVNDNKIRCCSYLLEDKFGLKRHLCGLHASADRSTPC